MIRIVVGFDGRRGGHDALALGRRFGRMLDAELVVICAYPFHEKSAAADAEDFGVATRADAQRVLDQARAIVGRAEHATFAGIPGPTPARALHEVAEGEDARLLVVGVTPRPEDDIPSSSTTWRVLHHAPCAVGVAPRGWSDRDRPVSRVAIAYDGKPEARAAVDAALALLHQSRPAIDRVEIVHVAASSGSEPVALDDAPGRLAVLGLVHELQLQGDAAAALIDHADELDLLVLGSHDRGAIGRLLLGSVSREVVARTHTPVLVRPWRRPTTATMARAAAFL